MTLLATGAPLGTDLCTSRCQQISFIDPQESEVEVSKIGVVIEKGRADIAS